MKTIKNITRFGGLTKGQLDTATKLLQKYHHSGLRAECWTSLTTGKTSQVNFYHLEWKGKPHILQLSKTGLLEVQALLPGILEPVEL